MTKLAGYRAGTRYQILPQALRLLLKSLFRSSLLRTSNSRSEILQLWPSIQSPTLIRAIYGGLAPVNGPVSPSDPRCWILEPNEPISPSRASLHESTTQTYEIVDRGKCARGLSGILEVQVCLGRSLLCPYNKLLWTLVFLSNEVFTPHETLLSNLRHHHNPSIPYRKVATNIRLGGYWVEDKGSVAEAVLGDRRGCPGTLFPQERTRASVAEAPEPSCLIFWISWTIMWI